GTTRPAGATAGPGGVTIPASSNVSPVRQDGGMTIPYGAWPSPITAADTARGAISLSFPAIVGDEVWWTESRPDEAGRQTVMRAGPDGAPVNVLPAPWNARTRVHEYGGRSWLAVPGQGGTDQPAPALVFANFADQRLYRLDPGAA